MLLPPNDPLQVEDTKRHKSWRVLCVVTTTATTATSYATVKTSRRKEFHGDADIGSEEFGFDVDPKLGTFLTKRASRC